MIWLGHFGNPSWAHSDTCQQREARWGLGRGHGLGQDSSAPSACLTHSSRLAPLWEKDLPKKESGSTEAHCSARGAWTLSPWPGPVPRPWPALVLGWALATVCTWRGRDKGLCDPTVGRCSLPTNATPAGVHCSHFHPGINPSFSQGHHIGAAHTQAPQQTGRFSVASGDTRRASGEASHVGRARGSGSVRHASQLGLPLLQRMSHSEWKGGKEREPQT